MPNEAYAVVCDALDDDYQSVREAAIHLLKVTTNYYQFLLSLLLRAASPLNLKFSSGYYKFGMHLLPFLEHIFSCIAMFSYILICTIKPRKINELYVILSIYFSSDNCYKRRRETYTNGQRRGGARTAR